MNHKITELQPITVEPNTEYKEYIPMIITANKLFKDYKPLSGELADLMLKALKESSKDTSIIKGMK